MFYLITRIKDRKRCSCCRPSNSTIVCFQQGNVIMYLFDEIWLLKRFTRLLISHTRGEFDSILAVLEPLISWFAERINSLHFLERVALRRAIGCETNAAHGADVVVAEAAELSVQIKHDAPSHALKSKLCQAGLTLTSFQAGRQLLVLTLISTVMPLDDWFLFVCVFECLCVCVSFF